MVSFLESVAEFLKLNYKNDLHSLVVVFPNKRTRLFFNKYLSESLTQPVFSPKYYTISEFMQELSGEIVADDLSLLFTLYEIYVSVTQSKESFDDFLFYCEMLLADFDDMDKYMADARMVYQNLADLKDINDYYEYLDEAQVKAILQFWETFNASKDSNEKKKFGNIWHVLFTIYEKFKNKLAEKHLSYEGMAYRKAIESLEKGEIKFPGQQIAFVGFNALNKCEEKLFTLLKNQQRGLFFWDYDKYYIDRQDFHEAAYFLSYLIRNFPVPAGFTFESNLAGTDKKITILDIPTKIGQAKLLPHALSLLSDNWQTNPVKTAIALADESLLLPVLTSIPESIGDINVSMGYPLKETLVFSLISILIELQKNKRTTSKNIEQFYHVDVKNLLQHGLLFDSGKKFIDSLINWINKTNQVFIDSDVLKSDEQLFNLVFQSGIVTGNFVPYLMDVFDSIINQAGSEEITLSAIEKEAAIRIITQLRRINDILSETNIDFNFKSLSRLIEKILKGTTIPFNGEPLMGVQIMGILETRTLDFDNLIVLSMNEGIFPKSGNAPSFIPYTLRKAYKLPTIEHQDAIYAYYFYRLMQRASNIVLVFSSSVSDRISGEPSRFIQQLLFDDTFKKTRQTIVYKIFPQDNGAIHAIKSVETRNLLSSKYSGENSKILSPSAINTYLNCKMRFYYRNLAGIPEPETILETIESNTLGTILHKAMQLLYTPIQNRKLSSSDFEAILKSKEQIEVAVDKAFYEEFLEPRKVYTQDVKLTYSGQNIIAREVILKYILNIIHYDIKNTPAIISGLEKSFSKKFILNNGLTVLVGGIVDRIEESGNTVRIIDYKTGKVKDSFSSIEDLFDPENKDRNDAVFQTFLYSLIVQESFPGRNVQPNLFFVREMAGNTYDSKIIMGGRPKIIIENIHKIQHEFEERLAELLEDMFDSQGNFAQTLNVKQCEYCTYKSICGK